MGSFEIANHTGQPKGVAKKYLLKRGRHRLKCSYVLNANPTNNENLLRIELISQSTGKVLRYLLLPRKPRPDGEIRLAQLDVSLTDDTEIRLEITLDGPGRVTIYRVEIGMDSSADLTENPMFLFINPDRGLSGEQIVHQGISSIAAYLKSVGVESHSAITSTSSDGEILDAVAKYRYKYVGFYTTSDDGLLGYVKNIASRMKALDPNIVVIAGGVHATLDPEDLLSQIAEVDLCVRGEGEKTCVALAEGRSWEEIDGLTFRGTNGFVHTPDREKLSADEMVIPRRDNYLNPNWTANSVSTSRGCPHRCHFCIGHRIFGRSIRFRPLEQIDAELLWLYENADHGLVISINDDMFNMRHTRTLALMEIFKKYPFYYFPRGMRADKLDAETAKAMRNAGVVGTSIGIECADENALKAMRKGETLEQIKAGIGHLKSNGIGIVGQFMIGNIGDTLETVEKTIEFIKDYEITELNISCAIPFPGTALREELIEKNLILEKPVHTFSNVCNGNTTIYFETANFSVEDRIKAVEMVRDAGLYQMTE